MTVKGFDSATINSVNAVYLIISKMNGYFEESNENSYLILFPINESKDTLKMYVELCDKIRDIIGSTTNNSSNFDEKYMKFKFNSDNLKRYTC